MEQENKTTKYFVYTRKSSESEDRQVLSIDAQKTELDKIAKKENLKIVRIFEESHSAKAPGRPIFNEMIQKIHTGEADGLLVWNPNRISRNSVDTGTVVYLLDLGVLTEVKTPGQTFKNEPQDKFMLGLFCGQAKLENDNKSVDVKRGMRAKAERGMWPGPAPTGYVNDKLGEKGLKQIKPDPELFALVRKMWDMILTGNYTVAELLRIINKKWGYKGPGGKKMGRSTLYNLLTKTMYYGEFEYPQGSGSWYKGDYETMITPEEYDKVQAILGHKGKPRPKSHIFTYTGMMKCGECGASITAEKKVKRQKNGNVHNYVYYHCTKRTNPECSQGSIELKEFIKQINKLIAKIQIEPEFDTYARKWFREVFQKEAEDRTITLKSQQRALNACISKVDGLIDMRAAGELTAEEFANKKAPLLKEKEKYEALLADTGNRVNQHIETVDNMITFIEQAQEKLRTGTREEKRQVLSGLGSNLVINDKELRMEWDNILFPMQKVSTEVKLIHKRLEPAQNLVNKGDLERAYARSPRLLPRRDSNPNFLDQNQACCRYTTRQ